MNALKNVVVALALVSTLFVTSVSADVTVTFDPVNSPAPNLVVGQWNWTTMGTFNLTNSDSADATVSRINLDVGLSGATSVANYTLYYNSTATNIYASPIITGGSLEVGGQAWISGLNIPIPGNSSTSLRVDAFIVPPDDSTSAPNGATLAVGLDLPNAVEYHTQGATLYASSLVSTNFLKVVASRPYVALDANSPRGDNLIPVANQLVGSFDVSADTAGVITLDSLTFNISRHQSSPDGAPNKFWLAMDGVPIADVNPVLVLDDASNMTFNLGLGPNGLHIAAGQMNTLEVYGDLSDFNQQGDYIQLSLPATDNSLVYQVQGVGGYSSQLAVGSYVGGVDAGLISNGIPAPEPSTLTLLVVGAAVALFAIWRHKR